MKKCCIFGGFGFCTDDFDFGNCKDAYIIAADKGYETVLKLGVNPDLIVGDFDSLRYVPKGENVICHNCEKDETDLALAVEKALERGCDELYIYGGVGGRIDHSFANFQLVCDLARKGVRACLFGESFEITAICNDTLFLEKRECGIVSVFCVGNIARGVGIKGLKYELCDYEMSGFVPLGVSNEFVGKSAEISVKDGVLLIMIEK